MDARRARVMSVTRIQRARPARVIRSFESSVSNRPCEVSFSFAYFSFGQAKEKYVSTDKKFFTPDERDAPNQTSVDFVSFCLTNERTPAAKKLIARPLSLAACFDIIDAADVAELADAPDLGSVAFGREGSTPSIRTSFRI